MNKKAKDETKSFIKPFFSSGKKGIMVKFLVTILITILVFAPTVMFISKLMGPSQTEKNFVKFANELKEFSKSGKDKDSFMLVMDSEIAIVGFTDSKFQTCQKRGNDEDCETWNRPDVSVCKSGNCVCLIQNLVERSEKEIVFPRTVVYKTFTCLAAGDITYEIPKVKKGPNDNPYEIIAKNGFLIGRNVKSAVFFTEPFDFTGRRNSVYFLKKDNELFICPDPQCNDLDFTYVPKKTEEEPIGW